LLLADLRDQGLAANAAGFRSPIGIDGPIFGLHIRPFHGCLQLLRCSITLASLLFFPRYSYAEVFHRKRTEKLNQEILAGIFFLSRLLLVYYYALINKPLT
jgi:hypothetical protein